MIFWRFLDQVLRGRFKWRNINSSSLFLNNYMYVLQQLINAVFAESSMNKLRNVFLLLIVGIYPCITVDVELQLMLLSSHEAKFMCADADLCFTNRTEHMRRIKERVNVDTCCQGNVVLFVLLFEILITYLVQMFGSRNFSECHIMLF